MLQWARSLIGGRSDAVRIAEAGRDRAQAEAVVQTTQLLTAKYDNAQTTDENKRNWWPADFYSAKAANSYSVRRTLRMRSRQEVSNNPWLWGICNNNADDLIGTGPTLQVLTKDSGYNREFEAAWKEWADEVGLIEKLRTQKLARTIDGEGFLILKTANSLENPVKLYPVDVEADQVTTYNPLSMAELYVDGLTLDPVTGRPVSYHVLRQHPGDFYFPELNPLEGDKVSAKFVLHTFPKFRPGQVRGVPVFTPSLDLFTELRSFRRSVLGAAQISAALTALITQSDKFGAYPEGGYTAFKRVPIDRNMMTMLPPGADAKAFDPKQPGTSYEMFQEKCLTEACRPLSYPLVAALNSSKSFNFSSSRLDIVNYRSTLVIEREVDCNRVTLDPMLREWFYEALYSGAVRSFDGIKVPPHAWHWPGFEPLDPVVDAQADHERLSHGTDTLRDFWARRGKDYEDILDQQEKERIALEKRKLVFGDPLKQNVTETVDDGSDASTSKEAAGAA